MKKLLPLLVVFLASIGISNAQVKFGIFGGANSSNIIESNSQANWNSIKKNYKPIIGYHGGLFAEFKLNKKGSLVFQPTVSYYNKGRKYFEKFDPAISTLLDSGVNQQLNYIDIPLNIVAKIRLAKKIKFFIGAGPYASFFISGKEKTTLTDLTGAKTVSTNADLPVGNGPGKYRTLDYGVNLLAGFEVGKFFLRAEASQSLGNMFESANYKGTFKNQVIGLSLGFILDIKGSDVAKKKLPDTVAAKPKEVKEIKDKDGDGVADKDDKCPDVKGTIANKGCPAIDTDNDGVPDSEDKCPNEKGTILTNGCPLPPVVVADTDGDGIKDDVDQCPNEKGLARYNGCPIPDTDGDGINDEIDRCKDVAGVKSKNGCPEKVVKEKPVITEEVINSVSETAKKIQFKQSSIDLTTESMSALDEIADLLTNNPEMRLKIEGHASREGDNYVNLGLSNSRANAVKNYLVSKGIDKGRLSIAYFGANKLITTDPGKQALNRRVELKPFY